MFRTYAADVFGGRMERQHGLRIIKDLQRWQLYFVQCRNACFGQQLCGRRMQRDLDEMYKFRNDWLQTDMQRRCMGIAERLFEQLFVQQQWNRLRRLREQYKELQRPDAAHVYKWSLGERDCVQRADEWQCSMQRRKLRLFM